MCRLIKDFEREARADGVPQNELAARKKALAAELNGFIALKKEFAQTEGTKADLLNGAAPEAEQALEGGRGVCRHAQRAGCLPDAKLRERCWAALRGRASHPSRMRWSDNRVNSDGRLGQAANRLHYCNFVW